MRLGECTRRRIGLGHLHLDIDVITSDDLLSADCADLDLDVDDAQGLGTDVDLDQAWVDRLVELSEPGYQANRSYWCG